jgi:hypothetical protein
LKVLPVCKRPATHDVVELVKLKLKILRVIVQQTRAVDGQLCMPGQAMVLRVGKIPKQMSDNAWRVVVHRDVALRVAEKCPHDKKRRESTMNERVCRIGSVSSERRSLQKEIETDAKRMWWRDGQCDRTNVVAR